MVRTPRLGANPTGYIYATIDNHLMEAADEESTIVVPYRTQKRAREEGKPIERPRPVGPKTTESCFSRLSTADLAAGYDLEDEIKARCRDDIDVKVVAMRIAGHKDQEIAEALGLAGHQAVSRRRKKIENRLKERCAEYAR